MRAGASVGRGAKSTSGTRTLCSDDESDADEPTTERRADASGVLKEGSSPVNAEEAEDDDDTEEAEVEVEADETDETDETEEADDDRVATGDVTDEADDGESIEEEAMRCRTSWRARESEMPPERLVLGLREERTRGVRGAAATLPKRSFTCCSNAQDGGILAGACSGSRE